jgi:DNA mismatch repair protein MutS
MQFSSILFDRSQRHAGLEEPEEPPFFADLHLDQIFESLTAELTDYSLQPIFYTPLHDAMAVEYRQQVFMDLEQEDVHAAVGTFAQRMRSMRSCLAQAAKLHERYQRERWFLDAVARYCTAVMALAEALRQCDLHARALLAFRDYLAGYATSESFTQLVAETQQLKDDLAGVRYAVNILPLRRPPWGNRVTVGKYSGEADLSAQVEEVFAKFMQGAITDQPAPTSGRPVMNHVEAWILTRVARLYPGIFKALDDYCARHHAYLDETLGAVDREVQFYFTYLDFIAPFRSAGLPFCYPRVSTSCKDVHACEAFDLALADTLRREHATVVCNDFYCKDPERIFVVTGPNNGGKTTFARMFGQLHYLACLGCPVPASDAELFLPDRLFTHFAREEEIHSSRGRLEDELTRLHEILRQATGQSIVIMNESFTSTTLSDAHFLGKEVMQRLLRRGLLCVYVTFVDELASLSDAIISMVGTVVPDQSVARTFKIVRMPADGRAYAAAIAGKYGLTYDALKRRLAE